MNHERIVIIIITFFFVAFLVSAIFMGSGCKAVESGLRHKEDERIEKIVENETVELDESVKELEKRVVELEKYIALLKAIQTYGGSGGGALAVLVLLHEKRKKRVVLDAGIQ